MLPLLQEIFRKLLNCTLPMFLYLAASSVPSTSSRSFAYIVFESVEAVSKAVDQLNGVEFQDRHLRVDLCKQVKCCVRLEKTSIIIAYSSKY